MGGGTMMDGLEEYYCLRGLEPYQSPSLNAEMHSQRYLHMEAVLQCQKQGHDEIARHVAPLSATALQRARSLAILDEHAVQQQEKEAESSSSSDPSQKQTKKRRRAPSQRRASMMASTSTRNSTATMPSHRNFHLTQQQQQPHHYQYQGGFLPTTTTATIPKIPVDVQRLKQMNAQFVSHALASKPTTLMQDCHLTLTNALLMRRRHSLLGSEAAGSLLEEEGSNGQQFLPVRRDSLHGLS